MTLDIHVTVELQPSPQLLQLLEVWQPRQPEPKQPTIPSMGETERMLHPCPEQPMNELEKFMEERNDLKCQEQKWDPLIEIPKFPISACTTPEHIPVPGTSPHFGYIETDDQRVWFRYISGNVWTTWDNIMKLERSLPADQKKFGKLLNYSELGNRRTAINYMIKAIRAGLVSGQAAGSQEDPDADFRPMLSQDTHIAKDGGKLEGFLED